jgi:hypothetical protein
MGDTVSVETNAARDAGAITAALYKGDSDSAGLLLGFYDGDPVAQSALCGALAAIAGAAFQTIDRIGEELMTVHGIPFASGRQALSVVLMKLAEPEPA